MEAVTLGVFAPEYGWIKARIAHSSHRASRPKRYRHISFRRFRRSGRPLGLSCGVGTEGHWTDGVGHVMVGGVTGVQIVASDTPIAGRALEDSTGSSGDARRYEVVFVCISAMPEPTSSMFSAYRYLVVTCFGAPKAVVIAAVAHGREHPDEHVLKVEVADRDRLQSGADRVSVFESGDIGDVWEW